MKKVSSVLLKILLAFISAVVIFLLFAIAPVNRTLPHEQAFYPLMKEEIDRVLGSEANQTNDTAALQIGFARVSITPSYPTSTAGYVKRKGAKFSSIRDSVWVRSVMLKRGAQEVAIVSLDMLIVPPVLYRELERKAEAAGFPISRIYLGATHTHNSIGNWDDHLVGQIYAGDFDHGLITFLADQIVTAVQQSKKDLQSGTLRYGVIPVKEAVNNRVIKGGPVDSLFHALEFNRTDGTKGIFTSFSAHATCMGASDHRLSRDYPGALVDNLEKKGYDFAIFMAGAVGSHAPGAGMDDADERIRKMGEVLNDAVDDVQWSEVEADLLRFHRLPLLLGQQQIKVLPNWRVREWLSLPLMGAYTPTLTYLQFGNLVMLGTPCDYSGMLTNTLYQSAGQRGLHVFVTSFNGGYIGYVTPDEYYDLVHYETQTMNWYGPGNGGYIQECLLRMLEKASSP